MGDEAGMRVSDEKLRDLLDPEIRTAVMSPKALLESLANEALRSRARLRTADELAGLLDEYRSEYEAPVPDYTLRRMLRGRVGDALDRYRKAGETGGEG